MEGAGCSPPPAGASKPKFSVYQNPAIAAALTDHNLRPSASALLFLFSSSLASAISLLALSSSEESLINALTQISVSLPAAQYLVKLLEISAGLAFFLTIITSYRALSMYNQRKALGRAAHISAAPSSSKPKEEQNALSEHQLRLLGLKLKVLEGFNETEQMKRPPKSKPVSVIEPLVPIRKSSFSYAPSRSGRIGSDHLSASFEKRAAASPALPSGLPTKSASSSPTSWSRQSSGSAKGIQTETMLEQFLADADEKIDKLTELSVRMTTPPATVRDSGVASPNSIGTSTTASGTARSTPLRPVRMSPGSHHKYSSPPKKGEGDLPTPMSIEHQTEAFENLGIYPQIEQWRDHLRQWFSSVLINPLLEKINTSHIQVKQAAASIGVSITVSQVGSDFPSTTTPVTLSPAGSTKDWQPTVTLDEEGLLHQLRATLLQARDQSMSQPSAGMQQPQQNHFLPAIQACVDAITEHQRLNILMKGELIKGLLPHSTVRADYTVQRVQALAEGTCLKNYDYMGNGDSSNKAEKKWGTVLPSDPHLLLYLFAAFLEHPKWMLHVDPSSYSGAQSSKNPLFLGILPPKERFPEKYVAIISGVPSIVHPGACILTIGKQNPPIFALYWDKKLQFSLQGRTALWDAILLLCHRINVGYGGGVRGVHLSSSALNILWVLELDTGI